MAKAKRPASLSSSSSTPELMKLLLEEEEAFKRGIEAIIHQHLKTLNQSYNRIQKPVQTSSLIHSYKRLGRIDEVENDDAVFHHSSDTLQKEIKSSIQVAQNITTIFQSILPRHTLDYVSDNKRFFLANFSKSENLKVSKFQNKTDSVRNKIVELAVKLYNLRTSRIKRSITESIQYGVFQKSGTLEDVDYIESILAEKEKDWWENNKKVKVIIERGWGEAIITEITERDEIMMKIEKGMKDLEEILFGIYVMVQTQAAISAYAISGKWSGGTGHHDNIESLAAKEMTLLSKVWFKSKINDIYYYYYSLH